MRRTSAIVLLALFSFSLIPMASSADSTSKLPACCRGDGKHGCSMKKTIEENPAGLAHQGQSSVSVVPEKLLCSPGGKATGAASPHRAVIAFVAKAYPSSPSPAFGRVTGVNDPRTVQLALRFRY